MKKKELLKIGELAKISEVSLRTIRYYHELGLITPTERSHGNFRLFTKDTIQIIKLINNLKNLGFTLEEIKNLLEPSKQNENDYLATISRTRLILSTEKQNVEIKLNEYKKLLEEIESSLETLDNCFECRKSRGSAEPCKPECNNKNIHIKL